MAAPSNSADGGKKRKNSKFGFKNGLKSLKSKVTKNDTVHHFAGDGDPSTDPSKFSQNGKSKKQSKKRKKFVAPVMPKLALSTYTFPPQILPPSESWGTQSYDDDERKIHRLLNEKYNKEIARFTFFPSDIVIRFTISQRGMTPFSARLKETELHFRAYLKYHGDFHSDDILSNQMLNTPKALGAEQEMMDLFPLFIYGQDMEGHPIFWDDGSAFAKDANLKVFQGDKERVNLFRTRLMKRMHNLKLSASKRYGRMIYKHCLVMDLAAFNSKKFVVDRKFHEQTTKEMSDLFPESLHRLYVINAPSAFRVAWKVIQTFLDPITAEKTKILGKDFIAEMIRDINLDMIPHKFGGIGPWDIRYGDTPDGYPLSTGDDPQRFDFAELAPNPLPVPPRAAPPDMNKHKARRDRASKASGLEDLDTLQIDDEDADGVDDEKQNDHRNEESIANDPQNMEAQSMSVSDSTQNDGK